MRTLFIIVIILASPLCEAELVGQQFASAESADTFTTYLSKHGIDFKVDDKNPMLIWWSPKNDKHMKYVRDQAFDIPVNQQQLLPSNQKEFERAVSLLKELNIKHNAGEAGGHFVVLWFPSDSKQKELFNVKYNQP